MKQEFNFNGGTINFDFRLDADVSFFSPRNSWHYAEDIKKGIDKILASQNVRFDDYNEEFVINGVAYRHLCVEFRDIGGEFGSPYITARRVDSWQDTLSDAARRKIVDELVPALREFAIANRLRARAELIKEFKQSAAEKIAETRKQLSEAQAVIEAA